MNKRSFMRKAVLLCCILLLFSCGKKEVKPESRESKTAQEAFAVAETIKDAFINNDLETIRKNTMGSGFSQVAAYRKDAKSVELTFTPRWVEIEKEGQVTLNIQWKSRWITSDKTLEDRGMTVFMLEGNPLRLSRIVRANPFEYPGQ
jgi:hypothetical protein